jgi:uncharacterized membrane-anchored protein
MLNSSQSGFSKCTRLAAALAFAGSFSLALPAVGQSSVPLPDVQPIEWVSGPTSVPLGALAQIQIPEGFKFTDQRGARLLLERMKKQVPEGLLGILNASALAGGSLILIQQASIGYVKDAANEQVDAAVVLSGIRDSVERENAGRAKRGQETITAVEWELKPLYDAESHTLEWALRAESKSGSLVNHTVRVLGRRGGIDVIASKPYKGFVELSNLKAIAKAVTFNEGERYADYRAGDKVAGLSLAELITLDNVQQQAGSPEAATAANASARTAWIWPAVIGLGVVALVALIIRLIRKHSGVPTRPDRVAADAPSPKQAAPLAEATVAHPVLRSPLVSKRANLVAKPLGANGSSRRKKVFDYNRYFTDLMGAVSNNGVQAEMYGTPALPPEGSRQPVASSSHHVPPNDNYVLNAHSELIATQKTLIEEQKKLIQEQARLIEEKSRLIAEKNQFLKLQSELINHNIG